jgi:hypothetical protein
MHAIAKALTPDEMHALVICYAAREDKRGKDFASHLPATAVCIDAIVPLRIGWNGARAPSAEGQQFCVGSPVANVFGNWLQESTQCQ